MTVVGIDLGTSNSLIGYWDGTEPTLFKNVLGDFLTPSVVGVDDDGQLLVGKLARARQAAHPALTAAGFKRHMGTAKKYQLGAGEYTPVELSAMVLTSLRQDAERALGETVDTAVISVPAYFNNLQREATIAAASIAGLTVQQLISEPTAAALAYGLHQSATEQFLILDLGGGTLDVSLLDMFEGLVQVRAIAGDNYLGGRDFTNALTRAFLAQDRHEPELTATEAAQLADQFERVKRQLQQDAVVQTTLKVREDRVPYRLDRKHFAELVAPLVSRLKAPIMRTLRDADLTPDAIDRVLLVGGASRMPVIQSEVARLFRRLPDSRLEPDLTVALGACVQTQLESDERLQAEMMMTDVAAYTLGTDIASNSANGEVILDVYDPIIERNTPIPVSIQRTYWTMTDSGQVEFNIYQGEDPQASANLKLGAVTLRTKKEAGHQVTARFSYDINGVLEVEVGDAALGTSERVVLTQEGEPLDEAAIQASLKKLAQLKVMPADQTENRLVLTALESLYAESTGQLRAAIQAALVDFRGVLASQDPRAIQKLRRQLQTFIQDIESRFE